MQISTTSSHASALLRIEREQVVSKYKESGLRSPERTEKSDSGTDKSVDASVVSRLQVTDTKVRAHEAAHLAAGGGVVAGGANFSYTRGPDGKMYAISGEVPIDSGEASTSEATIQKARQIAAAAMAPADPSPQDHRVATSAIMMEQRARMELVREQMEQIEGTKAYGTSSGEEERMAPDSRVPELSMSNDQ